MTNEEFEKFWEEAKRMEAIREAEYNALPEVERKRLEKEYSDPSFERFWEDPLGGDDEEEDDD